MNLPDAFWHGAFVFTTLRLEQGNPLWLQEHLSRLKNHSEALGLGFAGFETLEQEVEKYEHHQGLNLLRLVTSGDFVGSSLRPLTPPTPEQYAQGVKVHLSSIQIHPQLGNYKTGNYLPYRLAKQQAESVGAFEGLLLDSEGHVVDGSRSSLLVYQNETLYSMSGGLEGITRNKVLEKARELGINVQLSYFKPDEISGQLLLAGIGIGLLPVGTPQNLLIKQLVDLFRIN